MKNYFQNQNVEFFQKFKIRKIFLNDSKNVLHLSNGVMAKQKIKYGIQYKAQEVYAVLIEGQRPSKSFSKKEIILGLKDHELQTEFLKVCMEFDTTDNLNLFRKGLLIILQQEGIAEASKATGIPRTSIYRMLWSDGNPSLKNLIAILQFLNIHLWVVSSEFIFRGKSRRYKDEIPVEVIDSGNQQIKRKKPEY